MMLIHIPCLKMKREHKGDHIDYKIPNSIASVDYLLKPAVTLIGKQTNGILDLSHDAG